MSLPPRSARVTLRLRVTGPNPKSVAVKVGAAGHGAERRPVARVEGIMEHLRARCMRGRRRSEEEREHERGETPCRVRV
jgi:hypothetical protein